MYIPETKDDWYSLLPWIDKDEATIDSYVVSIPQDLLPSYNLKEILNEWHTHGVVVFKNVVYEDILAKVENNLDYIFENSEKHHLQSMKKYDVFKFGDIKKYAKKPKKLNTYESSQYGRAKIKLRRIINN